MNHLRIAAITRFPYTESDGFSGLPSVSKNFCNALARRKDIALSVVSGSRHITSAETVSASNYKIDFFPIRSDVTFYGTGFALATREITRRLRALTPDLVHSQAIGETGLAAVRCGLPAVATLHGIAAAERKQARGLKPRLAFEMQALAEAYYVRRLKHVIACSPYISRFVRERNPTVRLYDIANPMDDAFFVTDANAPRTRPHAILVIGTMVYRKGQDIILEAMPQILAKVPDATLTLVGKEVDAAFVSRLKARTVAMGISPQVRFLGAIRQEDLILEMQQHGVVCLPSREETLPMSISQAAISGNLPVASNAGGIPDMFASGIMGQMFATGSSADCASKIVSMLAKSDGEKAHIRALNRRFADVAYHADSVAAKTVLVYREILASAHA